MMDGMTFTKIKNKLVIILALLFPGNAVFAQKEEGPYRLNLKVDIPVTVVGIAGTLAGWKLRASKDGIDSLTVVSLNREDLKPIHRGATHHFSENWGKSSDFLLAGGFILPWFLVLDKGVRNDLGTVSLLYLQTMAITGLGYWGAAGLINKYRPYVYNSEVPFSKRTSKNARNSFFGGHPSVTAAGTFFIAQVYSDYHPESAFRYVLWPMAAAATITNAAIRYKGGFHFIDDLIVGVAFGTATGILVPYFHKKKTNSKVSIYPLLFPGAGLSMNYKLN